MDRCRLMTGRPPFGARCLQAVWTQFEFDDERLDEAKGSPLNQKSLTVLTLGTEHPAVQVDLPPRPVRRRHRRMIECPRDIDDSHPRDVAAEHGQRAAVW